MRFIFDLDDTVIDSSHRQRLLSSGSIDLEYWRAHSTVGLIARDSLLPLAVKMQEAIADDLDVWICTSRVMGAADYAFLRMHGLHPRGGIISRLQGDERGCGELKLAKLRAVAAGMGQTWPRFAGNSIMFDDSAEVQKIVGGAGLRVINPVQYNFTMQKVG